MAGLSFYPIGPALADICNDQDWLHWLTRNGLSQSLPVLSLIIAQLMEHRLKTAPFLGLFPVSDHSDVSKALVDQADGKPLLISADGKARDVRGPRT